MGSKSFALKAESGLTMHPASRVPAFGSSCPANPILTKGTPRGKNADRQSAMNACRMGAQTRRADFILCLAAHYLKVEGGT